MALPMGTIITATDSIDYYFYRFMSLNHYRIPRENLLNKTGDVTPDGRYVTPYKVTSFKCKEIL